MAMPEVDKNQLEALRDRVEMDYRRIEDEYRRAEENYRRAEENYHLDIAAIEHLQRRFAGAPSSTPTSEYSRGSGLNIEPLAPIQPSQPLQPSQPVSAARANEEWEIFKSVHK
jgi:hypothetical protein